MPGAMFNYYNINFSHSTSLLPSCSRLDCISLCFYSQLKISFPQRIPLVCSCGSIACSMQHWIVSASDIFFSTCGTLYLLAKLYTIWRNSYFLAKLNLLAKHHDFRQIVCLKRLSPFLLPYQISIKKGAHPPFR